MSGLRRVRLPRSHEEKRGQRIIPVYNAYFKYILAYNAHMLFPPLFSMKKSVRYTPINTVGFHILHGRGLAFCYKDMGL